MNDKDEWRECHAGMQALGMGDEELSQILSILSAILMLGQLDFEAEGADKSRIVDQKPIEVVAELLQCDKELLAQGMVQRTYSANNQHVLTPLNVEKAQYTRDALAKAIYFRLFQYVVFRINEAIAMQGKGPAITKAKAARTVGILDIYGFEVFEQNSFEQFTIN